MNVEATQWKRYFAADMPLILAGSQAALPGILWIKNTVL